MSTHQIHVFISHSWSHSGVKIQFANVSYTTKWTVDGAALDFRNFSVPKNNLVHNAPTTRALTEAIYNQIKRSHVIVIPTGMWVTHSNWIQKEISGSNAYSKPILAVNPRGQIRMPGIVLNNSKLHVGWTKPSVINGIWKLYNQN